MNADRARAYGRVMQTLNELGPSKLLADEQQRIRDAADTLILTADTGVDADARAALDDVVGLTDALVESGRWTDSTASRLVDDVVECGPRLRSALEAA